MNLPGPVHIVANDSDAVSLGAVVSLTTIKTALWRSLVHLFIWVNPEPGARE